MLNVRVQFRRPDFSLDVAFEQTARITGVFGPSGSGKTTLMHLIAGLARPDAGRIQLGLRTIFDNDARIDVLAHRRNIGLVFQDDRLFPHYSVEGNLRYGHDVVAQQIDRSEPLLDFDGVVELLNLRDLLARRVATLSGGERQRVALGRALLANPAVLLLDEPLSSLDAVLKRQIIPYLRKVRDAAGIPMLYVSHDLTEMLQITDHLLLLERGRVVANGPFHELAHQHAALDALQHAGLLNVLSVTHMGMDDAAGTTRLSLDARGGRAEEESSAVDLRAPFREESPAGSVISIVIRAADIAIALQRVEGISIQNQLRGEVTRITQHAGRAIVEVNVSRPLLAELTLRAVESLQIQPGKTVWCLIKSNAIRRANEA